MLEYLRHIRNVRVLHVIQSKTSQAEKRTALKRIWSETVTTQETHHKRELEEMLEKLKAKGLTPVGLRTTTRGCLDYVPTNVASALCLGNITEFTSILDLRCDGGGESFNQVVIGGACREYARKTIDAAYKPLATTGDTAMKAEEFYAKAMLPLLRKAYEKAYDPAVDNHVEPYELIDKCSAALEGQFPENRSVVVASGALAKLKADSGELMTDIKAGLSEESTTSPSTMKETAMSTTSTLTLNEALINPLNALLNPATNGAFNDIKALIDSIASSKAKADEADAKVRELSAKLKTASLTPAVTEVAATGEYPTGKVEMVLASDVFAGPRGKKSKALDFQVPKWTWDAHHPLVPAVDPNYKFRLKHLLKVLWALSNNKKMWLYGHSGTGKTTLIEQVCALIGYPVMRINLDSGIERQDLIGSVTLREKGGTTVSEFVDGVLPQAMGMPCLLLIDEIDFGRSDVMYAIQRVLEDKGLLINEDGGRLVMPHSGFRIAATANTKGQGDEYGVYQGARVQSLALLDRFTVWAEVDYLDAAEETQLLVDRNPALNPADASLFVKFSNEIRNAFKGGELLMTISPRGLDTMAMAFTEFTPLMPSKKDAIDVAMDMTILSKATNDAQQRIKEIAKRVFSGV